MRLILAFPKGVEICRGKARRPLVQRSHEVVGIDRGKAKGRVAVNVEEVTWLCELGAKAHESNSAASVDQDRVRVTFVSSCLGGLVAKLGARAVEMMGWHLRKYGRSDGTGFLPFHLAYNCFHEENVWAHLSADSRAVEDPLCHLSTLLAWEGASVFCMLVAAKALFFLGELVTSHARTEILSGGVVGIADVHNAPLEVFSLLRSILHLLWLLLLGFESDDEANGSSRDRQLFL